MTTTVVQEVRDGTPAQAAEREAGKRSPLYDVIPALVTALGALALLLGIASLASNELEQFPAPLLAVLGFVLLALLLQVKRVHEPWDSRVAVLAIVCLMGALVLDLLPTYVSGFQFNAVVHRSVFSALLLIGVSAPAIAVGLYHLHGGTPRADDIARYPLVLIPVLLVLGAYGVILIRIVKQGLAVVDRSVLFTPYRTIFWREETWTDGWPTWADHSISEVGLQYHISGTILLIVLTALIATPIGVSVGVYVSEFGPPLVARILRGSTLLLRSVSAFVLGLLALSLVRSSRDTVFADPLAGFYTTVSGVARTTNGSFLLGAAMIALLVIPVIARTTEDGCRSLPHDLREGAWSLGGSMAYNLRRIVLPWALPSIVTGVLLACAEAAGSLTVIMFMAGAGDNGVGLFREVTSLSFVAWAAQYGVSKPFRDAMQPYQFTAALLLLLITVGLTIVALALKNHFAERYQGAGS